MAAPLQSWRAPLADLTSVPARKNSVAGCLAAAANFCADPAVLVVGGVPVALLGAGDACRRAGFYGPANESDVRTALPHCDARRCVADVRTVEADANHTDQRLNVALAEAGVCAGRAACPAIDTFLRASQESIASVASR